MADLNSIEGKTVLITGGASGLGAAYAEVFLKSGAKSLAIVDIDEVTGKATTDRLNKTYSNKVVFVKCDVSKEDDVDSTFKEVVDKFGYLDVLVNNAGVMSDASYLWRKSCEVNWLGVVSFTLKAVAHMRKDDGGKGGTIVNVASATGIEKIHVLPIYCGSKAAVIHFSQTISETCESVFEVKEPRFFERTGIRVMVIGFGPTATPLLDNMSGRVNDVRLAEQIRNIEIPKQRVDSAVAAFFNPWYGLSRIRAAPVN